MARATKEEIRAKDRERYRKEKPKRLAAVKRWAKANPEKVKQYQRKSKYNLTGEQFEAMLQKQDNACCICKEQMAIPFVDHDHKCCPGKKSCGKCIRGLLCLTCNTNLGVYESGWLSRFEFNVKEYLHGQR